MRNKLSFLFILFGFTVLIILVYKGTGDEIVNPNPFKERELQGEVTFDTARLDTEFVPKTWVNPNSGEVGTIITYVEGFDVKKVNLHSSLNPSGDSYSCSLEDGTRVRVLLKGENYWYVQSLENFKCKGYCLPGHIKLD